MSVAGRKVLEVVGSLAVGGAERVAIEVAAGLAERKWRPEIVVVGPAQADSSTPYAKSVGAEAEKRGVPVRRLQFDGLRDAASRRRFREFLTAERPALVHVHNRPQDWQVIAMCKAAGVPATYSVHMAYPMPAPHVRLLYHVCGRAVPRVVCVARAVADNVKKTDRLPESRLRVIYNGIRMDVFRPSTPEERAAKRAAEGWPADAFVWICAARLHPQKGHSYLLDAAARLPKSSRSVILLAGEGPLEADLQAQHARLGLGERVVFLGPRRDVPELLGAVDAFVSTSMSEGHPLSILEAMAMHAPIVAPRLPSIVEIATEGTPVFFGPHHAGWASPHHPDQIAAAMLDVETNADAHRARARAGRAHVESRYSREAMIDAHEGLYREILGER
jgi:glycosyltransferase involved in cell wall biosynthesis